MEGLDDEVSKLKAQVAELTAANEALRKQSSEAGVARSALFPQYHCPYAGSTCTELPSCLPSASYQRAQSPDCRADGRKWGPAQAVQRCGPGQASSLAQCPLCVKQKLLDFLM